MIFDTALPFKCQENIPGKLQNSTAPDTLLFASPGYHGMASKKYNLGSAYNGPETNISELFLIKTGHPIPYLGLQIRTGFNKIEHLKSYQHISWSNV